MHEAFHSIGAVTDSIDVRLSYRIIQLFSEGLYSSPNKAIEELVVNSFDAGALHVQVLISADLDQPDSSIAVIDDGSGMSVPELQSHWIVGASTKRDTDYDPPRGRRPIGKFGIGKLASYVLGNRLTHITKVENRFYSVSMDYSKLPNEPLGYIPQVSSEPTESTTEYVRLDVRELGEAQADEALRPWTSTRDESMIPQLFGDTAVASWTVAVMSDLKPMASDIRLGRLRHILRTAMPLRDDFRLYLNGQELDPFRVNQERLGSWILGKDLLEIPRPSPQDLEPRVDQTLDESDMAHFGLGNGELGRIRGYMEVFEQPIDTGKSVALLGRSNGFFVYARGRLLNTDESGFGIDRNLLRHGTFSRTRIVLHADRLDNELRSSRESIREGEILTQVRHVLHGLFNFARTQLTEHEETTDPALRLARRLAASPASVAERPIILGVREAMAKGLTLRTVAYPMGLESSAQEEFVDSLRERAETDEGLIAKVVPRDLTNSHSIALLSVDTGVLEINTIHPFVANFIEDFVDSRRNLPLELLAASEVVLEMALALIVHENGLGDGWFVCGVFGRGFGAWWGVWFRVWALVGWCLGLVVGVGARGAGPPGGRCWRLWCASFPLVGCQQRRVMLR